MSAIQSFIKDVNNLTEDLNKINLLEQDFSSSQAMDGDFAGFAGFAGYRCSVKISLCTLRSEDLEEEHDEEDRKIEVLSLDSGNSSSVATLEEEHEEEEDHHRKEKTQSK